MSRLQIFNHPLLLGFEEFERTLDRIAKSGDGYPPYNIEQRGENLIRITLAVAGFSLADLTIHVEDSQLVIQYLHRGIAARQFQRSYVLAEGLQVVGATLDNGLLHIDLERPQPESRIRRIEIRDADAARAGRR